RDAVAEQTGWKFADTIDVSADAGARAALVAGRHSDRIHGFASGKTVEDFRDAGGGRHGTRGGSGRSQPGRSDVDAERRCDCIRGNAVAGLWNVRGAEHSRCGLEDFASFGCAGLGESFQSTLFSRWEIHCRVVGGLDEALALRL